MTVTDLSAGIIVAVLTHGAATIWWASKINTTLVFMREDVKKLSERLQDHEKEIKAIWRVVDEIHGSNGMQTHKEIH